MTADGGLGEAQSRGQVGRGGRSVVQDGAGDTLAGAPLTGRLLLRHLGGSTTDVFHNTIVA